MLTAADIETAAIAAYATYQQHRRRPMWRVTPWEDAPADTQRRWILAAAAVLNCPALSPCDVRFRYLNGDQSWAWDALTAKSVALWGAVTKELRRQADALAAREARAA